MTSEIRRAGEADVAWMADLMEAKRAQHEPYSPVFWRRADNARAAHVPFLSWLIAQPDVVALRDDVGFIVAERKGDKCFVDDFTVDSPDRWPTSGTGLLLAAWHELAAAGGTQAKVVTAQKDAPKRAMLEDVGLGVGEAWAVLALESAPEATAAAFSPVEGEGWRGLVTPAPPVYDPGGPVCMMQDVESGLALAAACRDAAMLGAVLAILPLTPDQAELAAAARDQGFEVASEFFVGTPRQT